MTLLDARLAGIIAGCQEREAARYVVDGVTLVSEIETLYRAPLSDPECDEMQRRIGFGLLHPVMARAMRRPAPLTATA